MDRSATTNAGMQQAYADADWVKLRRDAHSLKGACGYIASERLRGSALELQHAAEAVQADASQVANVGEILQRVNGDMALVCATITAYLESQRQAAP